jgi:hypothetical protein
VCILEDEGDLTASELGELSRLVLADVFVTEEDPSS